MSITSTTQTHYLTDNSTTLAKKYDRQALLWDIAAKVQLVAVFALGAAILTLTFYGTIHPAFFILALLTPVLLGCERYFAHKSAIAKSLANIEHGVALKLINVKDWDKDKIRDFYIKHSITIPSQYHDCPQFLLPLIARYKYWNNQFKTMRSKAEESLDLNDVNQRDNRQYIREKVWDFTQHFVVPARLQSGLMLQLLQNPNQSIDELDKIGSHTSITFGQHCTEVLKDNMNDFFDFYDKTRISLTTSDLLDRNISIRELMFGQ